MGEQVSIWRWAVTDDLDARFAQLVSAPEEAFAALGVEMAAEGGVEPRSLDDVEAETVAKFRAMDLPEDVFQTMLAGFRTMMEEARAEEALAVGDDIEPDPDGCISVALASSHVFLNDPYAALEGAEIERQVNALIGTYRAAISKAVGAAGQDFAEFLGAGPDRMRADDTVDVLLENGLEGVLWVWPVQDGVFFLSQWQEDRGLPVDLEFCHAPSGVFEGLRAQILQ